MDQYELPATPYAEFFMDWRPELIRDALNGSWGLTEEQLAVVEDGLNDQLGVIDWRECADDEIHAAGVALVERMDAEPAALREAQDFHRSDRSYEEWVDYLDRAADHGFHQERAATSALVIAAPRTSARARGAGRPRATSRSSSRDSGDDGAGEPPGEPEPRPSSLLGGLPQAGKVAHWFPTAADFWRAVGAHASAEAVTATADPSIFVACCPACGARELVIKETGISGAWRLAIRCGCGPDAILAVLDPTSEGVA